MVCLENGKTEEDPPQSNEIKDGTAFPISIESSSTSGSEQGNKAK